MFHGGSKVAGEKGTVEAQKAKRYREKDGWGEKERRKKGEKEVEKGIEAHTVMDLIIVERTRGKHVTGAKCYRRRRC